MTSCTFVSFVVHAFPESLHGTKDPCGSIDHFYLFSKACRSPAADLNLYNIYSSHPSTRVDG